MENPDRYARMVKDLMEKDGGLWSDSAVKLLRLEHAWVMNMVKNLQLTRKNYEGYQYALDCVLEQLDERKK